MPISEADIRVLALAVIDARLNLHDAIREFCPGPHNYVQHRDGRAPWCKACGYSDMGSRVTRPNSTGACERGAPHLWGIDGRCDTCGSHQDEMTAAPYSPAPSDRAGGA